jgi:hypothetical protein
MSGEERTVDLRDISKDQAAAAFSGQGGTSLAAVEDSVPKFKKHSYPTFLAEYDLQGNDLVVHFFLPTRKVTEHYWKNLFAEALNEIGQEHFQATKPRLLARYTEELHSWWFKAQGYSHIINLDVYVTRFFEKLEERMAPALQTQSQGT